MRIPHYSSLSNPYNITPVRTITEFDYPWGVAVSDDGHVIVAEWDGRRVTILDNKGKKVKSFGGRVNVQFSAPQKFMQVGIDVKCMYTSFGGCGYYGFGDISTFKNGQISLSGHGL